MSEELLNRAFFSNPIPLFVTRLSDGCFLDANPAFCRFTGYGREELIGRSSLELGLWHENTRSRQWLTDTLRDNGSLRGFDARIAVRGGQVRECLFSLELITYAGEAAVLGTFQDITARIRAQAELRKERDFIAAVLDTVDTLVLVLDADGRIVRFNRACEALTGYSFEELRGRYIWDVLLLPEEQAEVKAQFSRLTAGDFPRDFENHWVTRDGDRRLIAWSNTALLTDDGAIEYVVPTGVDITERKKTEARLLSLANYDPLTGLPNRNLFQECLHHALGQARRGGQSLALMFLDLDDFKVVNDTLGHAAGDAMLREAAERLKNCVRDTDTVARLGGDEFTLILEGLRRPEDIVGVAQQILGQLSQPFDVRGHEIYSAGSIGITVFPADGNDMETLLKNADAAMYRAKSHGGGTYEFFTPDLNRRAAERLMLERALRRGIAAGELPVHYQPQMDLRGGRVVGVEALVRWAHPEKGLVLPGEFIPHAERTGLIFALGEQVLRNACSQCQRWRRQGLNELQLAVNVSARQFQRRDFADLVRRVLTETGLPASNLVIEITESVLLGEIETRVTLMQELKDMGVHLSVDDFGTGYSSLVYLKRFPIDSIKLDRQFVQHVCVDVEDLAICRAVAAMGRSLDIRVVAEGVETWEQLAVLAELGCDAAQGFVFSPPMAADAAGPWLHSGQPVARN
ncbi:MAG: EAL domain-containing protein [Gammaproteobacteria bacterium]